jgi:hypothetical protein
VVSGVTGAVQGARLRLRVVDAGPDGGFVYSVSNNFAGTSTPWTENALTFRNAPALGANRGFAGSAASNAWVEVDVTSAITGNGTFSFAVSGGSNNLVSYSSSEGANAPQLVVVASGSVAQVAEAPSLTAAAVEPGELALYANHPNPFAEATTIRYSLPHRMPVKLVIYDISGRAVRTLVDGTEGTGPQRASWDGRDATGSRVNAGIYLLRLEAGGTRLTRKVNVMR